MSAAAGPLQWWRVELSQSGKVVSCRATEAASSGSLRIVHVQARTESDAHKAALAKFQAMAQKALRSAWKKEGKCTRCGGKRDVPGSLSCAACNEKMKRAYARRAARENGDDPPSPGYGYGAGHQRLSVLREVQRAWQAARNNQSFTAWLREQIERSERNRAA